jgi:hypothetical protein
MNLIKCADYVFTVNQYTHLEVEALPKEFQELSPQAPGRRVKAIQDNFLYTGSKARI